MLNLATELRDTTAALEIILLHMENNPEDIEISRTALYSLRDHLDRISESMEETEFELCECLKKKSPAGAGTPSEAAPKPIR